MLARIFLFFISLFTLLGVAFGWFDPESLTEAWGIAPPYSAELISDLRAELGMWFAVSLVMLYAALSGRHVAITCYGVALLLGGSAIGRTIDVLALEAIPELYILQALILEWAFFVLLSLGYLSLKNK